MERRPRNFTALQDLIKNPKITWLRIRGALCHAIPPPASEYEQVPGVDIQFEVVAHQRVQAIETLATMPSASG